MNKIIIVDLDNCISDDEWRIPRINWKEENPDKRFEPYHRNCNFDEFENADIVENDFIKVIFTARPEEYRFKTFRWLTRNKIDVKNDFLFMRKSGDHRESVLVKISMLHSLFLMGIKRKDIFCAYDDMDSIIEMYKNIGIHAEKRFIHNSNAADWSISTGSN